MTLKGFVSELGVYGFLPVTENTPRDLEEAPQKMVLSNKKLKQKLRAELAESTDKNLPSNNSDSNPENPETLKSLKQLLDSAAQKPRLSKREKRRKTLNLQSPQVVGNEISVENKVAHVGETENGKGKKRKREKKRSEDQKTGGVDGELGETKQGGDLKKEEETSKKNAKKKKKLKKRRQKKGQVNEQGKQSEVDNGAAAEQIVPQNVEYNNRYCIVFIPVYSISFI